MFGNLKTEMRRRRLSESDLARMMDISPIALARKLNGLRSFTLNEIECILRIFSGCGFEYLFADDDSQY
jgi:transcriptional regulator with XRE-family HTH domain